MRYDHRIMGRVIREIRKKKLKSQEVISGFADIDRTHLTKIETGQHSANVETIWRIAEALDMRPSELFRLVEDEINKDEAAGK